MESLGFVLAAAVTSLFVCLHTCEGAEWSYTGAKGVGAWATNYPGQCDGQRQSPIDLKSSKVYYDGNLKPFTLMGFDSVEGVTWQLLNNGHTAQVTYTGGNLTVKGGSLGGKYKVAQFHFHWGSDSTKGSEHTVDGAEYPMEVHIVCANEKYSTLGQAVANEDGLAVLGFFYEIAPNDNPTMQKLIDSFGHVKYADNTTSIQPFKLNDLIAGYEDYYRYKGGLTTPTCNEVVTWTVFKDTIKISEKQMRAFRGLMDSHMDPIVNNYRPVQKLEGRGITASFDDEKFASASPALLFNSLGLLSSLALSLLFRL